MATRIRWRPSLQHHPPHQYRQASSSSLQERPFRIGIVGAGPAGFYAATRLLSAPGSSNTRVDLFEVLPVPFGLVRFGVAPDHPEVKNCEHKFEETARDKRFRFFGNVQIGGVLPSDGHATLVPNLSPSPHAAQISLSALQPHYDAILLTYGASLDRALGIPGEHLSNVLSARSFVGWYNGHPSAPLVDLSNVERATVIGQGNVAIDVARILLKRVDDWKGTDLPEHVLAELAKSRVKEVEVVGRRGALQLAATTKELREMMALSDVAFSMSSSALKSAQKVLEEFGDGMEQGRMRRRALGLLAKGSSSAVAKRKWSLEFCQSPTRLLPSTSSSSPSTSTLDLLSTESVKAVEYDLNDLVSPSPSGDPSTYQARPTGEKVIRPTDMVFKSVGYRSVGLPGFPFDEKRGVVLNDNGRVVTEAGERIPGMYTSGWLARGPNGVIATTMFDAFATADLMLEDLASSSSTSKPEVDIESLAGGRRVVSWRSWEAIDKEERRRGEKLGKPREKMTDVEDMLRVLG